MNLNALTLDEIIRTTEPETDLERRLLSFLTDARFVNLDEHECPDCSDKDYLESKLGDVKGAHEALEYSVDEVVDALKKAIETLED
jgi:hypothetical protein